ncbi:type IV pilus modification PilV family protein [Burkholderia contaminans]|uniref:type IV pilus modification PilV family protein n=1 Tax=Burkholderia contaminans TaxID=488447 RepID=UPI003D66FBC2
MCDDRTDYNRHARGGSRTARAPERGFTLIEVLIALDRRRGAGRRDARDWRRTCTRCRISGAIVGEPPPDMLQPMRVRLRLAPNPDAAAACRRRRPACRDARGRVRKWHDIVITYDVIA